LVTHTYALRPSGSNNTAAAPCVRALISTVPSAPDGRTTVATLTASPLDHGAGRSSSGVNDAWGAAVVVSGWNENGVAGSSKIRSARRRPYCRCTDFPLCSSTLGVRSQKKTSLRHGGRWLTQATKNDGLSHKGLGDIYKLRSQIKVCHTIYDR
jgi:hypothetical protein